MNIPNHFWVFWFILTTIAVTSARHFEGWETPATGQDIPSPPLHPLSLPAISRPRRSIGGFFTKIWTVGSLGKAQYDDTRSSLAKIYEMLRDSFSDTMIKKTPAVVVQSGAVGNGTSSGGVTEMPESTTTEKYRISRKELGRILNRNFRGLKRLAEIERRDAANATKYNIQEYKVQLANSLQSFVYNLPSKPAN